VRREAVEHVIRAAAMIVDDDLVLVGSQAILARFPDAPADLLVSDELDLYPRSQPERAIEVDAMLGAGSHFEETFGYRAHGVGPETAHVPTGWEERLIRVEVDRADGGTAIAWALEPHDLVISKLAAGREQDFDFAEGALRAGLVDGGELVRRCAGLPDGTGNEVLPRVEGVVVRARR